MRSKSCAHSGGTSGSRRNVAASPKSVFSRSNTMTFGATTRKDVVIGESAS